MPSIECVASTEEDRLAVARTLADPSYQAAYQAQASMQDMRSGTARVSAHGGVRQVRAEVQVVPLMIAGVGCEWLLPPATPVPTVGQPFLVYMHGGGFVRGSLDLGRANASELAWQAGLPVLAVGYRQAPEHPYPAALDDARAVWSELTGPGGDVWAWGDEAAVDQVTGPALDFCLVVTQRRNVAETALAHAGNGSAWLRIAQCFAGAPADPPPPRAQRPDA